ncbi:MAG TPA: hypothetical protein VNU68_20255 [Verrucomicrobiae bacterium]|nr:hypothetical protein [Verrucomicrobiae bacterium]
MPPTAWTSVAASADGLKLVAVSASGLVYRSVDGGSVWASAGDAPLACWRSVASSADGSKPAIAPAYGTVFTSTNSGASWVPRAPSNGFNLTSIASSADGNKLLVSAYGGGIYAWQSTPEPWLNISSAGSDFVLSWLMPAMPFVLQENTELTTTSWTNVTSPPALNLTNLQNQVIVSRPVDHRFYRLKH